MSVGHSRREGIVSSRQAPLSASALRILAQTAERCPPRCPSRPCPGSEKTRPHLAPALFVNVMAGYGQVQCPRRAGQMRWTITRVLPEPRAAQHEVSPGGASTASFCWDSSLSDSPRIQFRINLRRPTLGLGARMSVPSGYIPLETVTFGAIQEPGPSNTPGEVTVLQPISTSSPITAPNFVRPVSIRSPAARRTMFFTAPVLFSSSVLSSRFASFTPPAPAPKAPP